MLRQNTKEKNHSKLVYQEIMTQEDGKYKLVNQKIMTNEVNKYEIGKPKMFQKVSCFMLILILGLLLIPAKSFAAIRPIYNNDFEKAKQSRYTDKVHGNAFYKDKIISLDKQCDKMTITLFINPTDYLQDEPKLFNIKNEAGDDEIYVSITNEANPKWVVKVGDAIVKSDNIALLDNWTFIAIVFDKSNNQMRVIINDKVYYKNTEIETLSKKVNLNMFECNWIDDLNIYDTILTLEELETLKASPIASNRGYYKIYNKSEYIDPVLTKGISLSKDLKNAKGDLEYKVTSSALYLERTIDSEGEYIVQFNRGDIVKVKKIDLTKNKVSVETLNGKKGYLSLNDFMQDLIPADTNLASDLYFTYWNIGNAHNKELEVKIVYVVSIILLISITYTFTKFINKNHVYVKGLFTPSIYLFVILIASLFFNNDYEFYWFIHGGWKTIPYGYTETFHWALLAALGIFIIIHAVKFIRTISKYGIVDGFISFGGIVICNIYSFFILLLTKNILKNQKKDILYILFILIFVGYILSENKAYFVTVWSNDTNKHPFFQFKGKSKKDDENAGKNTDNSKNAKATEDSKNTNNTGKSNNNNDINFNKTYDKNQNMNNNSSTSNNGTNNSNSNNSNTSNSSTNNTNYNRDSSNNYYNSNSSNSNSSSNNSNSNSYNSNSNNSSGNNSSSSERKLNYFKGVTTQEELRTRYKGLLKMYHPDNHCGDNEITQEINAEYEYVRNKIKN